MAVIEYRSVRSGAAAGGDPRVPPPLAAGSRALEAGRRLFAVARQKKDNPNDADRLRKYLSRFGLSWQMIVDVLE